MLRKFIDDITHAGPIAATGRLWGLAALFIVVILAGQGARIAAT